MGNEVEKFDPTTLMQGVKDRIKATFVSLIPEEKWEQLVETEIKNFFEPKKMKISSAGRQSPGHGFGNTRERFESDTVLEIEMSPFQQIIWDMCAERGREKLKTKIEAEYFDNQWNLDESRINDNLKQIIVQASPLVITKLFEKLSFDTAVIVKNMLRN